MSTKKKKVIRLSKKGQAILFAVFAVIAVLLIVTVAAQKLGNVTINTMTSNLKSYIMSMGSGEGYPCNIDSDSVKNITVNDSNLLILMKDKTTVLNSTAKEIMPKNHEYINPAMKTAGSKAIVYDLDSDNFRIQNSSEVTGEYKADNRIIAAAMGRSGNYAVGTYGDNVQSVLTVYGRSNKKIFVWNFKSERISDIALSDNGKFAAVTTLFSKEGKISSKLYVFNFKSDKYVSCFDYDATVLVNVDYVNGNDVVAVGDNIRTYISNGKTKKEDIKFNSDVLHNYCMTDNGVSALVRSKYGSKSLSSLTVYKNNKEKCAVDFDKEVKWMDCDGKHTAVLFENEVRTYNNHGKQTGSITFSGEPVRVNVDGSRVYVLTSVSLQRYKVNGSQGAA